MSTQTSQRKLDMLHGSIWNKIPQFALPVAATAILEQLFNASDVAVVGNFTGADRTLAVAAVGSNSSIISLIVNLFIGIALGTNVVIAHAIGHGDRASVEKAVHTSILASLLGGAAVTVFGELIAAPLLAALQVPEDVFPLALLYLRIYLLGMPVILLYNFESAIFRSVGETKIPLAALAASGVLNVILNLFFVIVLHMTVNGVAIATVVSNAVSSLILSFRSRAAQEGIQLEISVENDLSQIATNVYETNKIIGNLLQNALDETQQLKDRSYGIHLSILKRGEFCMIHVSNRAASNQPMAEYRYGKSKKASHEGIGIASIQALAQRYGGMVYFRMEGDIIHFVAKIPLVLAKEAG